VSCCIDQTDRQFVTPACCCSTCCCSREGSRTASRLAVHLNLAPQNLLATFTVCGAEDDSLIYWKLGKESGKAQDSIS
jgi:hypothetical protein